MRDNKVVQEYVVGGPQRTRTRFERLSFVALFCFIFTLPWENAFVFEAGVGSLGRMAGIIAFSAGILGVIDTARVRRPSALHLVILVYMLWGSFTWAWSAAPEESIERIATSFQLLFMTLLICQYAETLDKQLSLMRAYVYGTIVAALITFHSFMYITPEHYERYVPQGFDPNDLALTLALSVPMSLYIMLRDTRSCIIWIQRVHIALVIGAIVLSASRGALIATIVSLTFVPAVLARHSVGQNIIHLLAAVAVLIGVLAFVPASSLIRLRGLGKEVKEGTMNSRMTIWQAGFDEFRTTPIQGIGVGAYASRIERALGKPAVGQLVAHNTFVSVLVEQGIVGFGLFVGILLALVLQVSRLPTMERRLWYVLLACWVVGVFALTWEHRKPTWFLFGLITAQANVSVWNSIAHRRFRQPPANVLQTKAGIGSY